ncbi:DUF3618 domain-containing protein [Nesterenkonia sp. Act20]|uniref:DUF3618 domain-containing protein n=1 Tax=Nesterenkonia sp. Act20 TaxID=1483432 RepID=UPI001C45C66C|nr:DUF3618 domain-containing protein [Nesterenkonia sp. Act20]
MTTPNPEDPQTRRSTRAAQHERPVVNTPEPPKDASVAELEADLERTRRELGETVGALAGKLDVKEQAREQVQVAKSRLVEQRDEAREHVAAYLTDARGRVTDERGRPTRNAWLGVTAAGAVATVVAICWPRR